MPWVRNWSHEFHRFCKVGEATMNIIHCTAPIWPQVITIEKRFAGCWLRSYFEVMCTTRVRLHAQDTQFLQDGITKLVYRWEKCLNVQGAIMPKSDFSVDYNSECVVCWFDFKLCEIKMVVFWVVAPCSLVEVYQRFRGPCCFHH
jgi:hypothetical protein